jgi:hypothetical protein
MTSAVTPLHDGWPALLVKQAPGQESRGAANAAAPLGRLRGEPLLHGREQGGVEDRLVIAAEIEPVRLTAWLSISSDSLSLLSGN